MFVHNIMNKHTFYIFKFITKTKKSYTQNNKRKFVSIFTKKNANFFNLYIQHKFIYQTKSNSF